jgi:hypothetical protein
MREKQLHDLVTAYKIDGKGREIILEKVADLVYSYYEKFGFDDEDDAATALFKYRNRIARLVDRFEDRGLPFDAYLAASLRYLAKTVRRERKMERDRELVCERAADTRFGQDFPNESLRAGSCARTEIMPAFGERGQGKRRPRARGGFLRYGASEAAAYSSRLVYLAVKCAWEMDEECVRRVAASAGVDCEWLAAAVEQARRSLEAERSRVGLLEERRNASWCRQRLLEARIAAEPEPYRHSRLETSLAREKGRYARVREELDNQRILVPNSVVARILGVPKGTVDSGLYYLRKHFGPQ